MLKELQISGFALIEKVEMSFYSGFSVLTGETGAGKSIIIDALSLLLGARASVEMIRTGSESAIIEGLFEPPDAVYPILEQWGFDLADELIITREIYRNGRNKCRINGNLVTVGQLVQVGQHLVDILGQLDHQNILDTTKHMDILDSFADQEHEQLIQQVSAGFQEYQRVKKARMHLQTQERERLSRIDLLQFQIQEIEQAEIYVGEEEELTSKRDVLANIEKITTTAESAYSRLQEETPNQPAIYDMLAQVADELASLTRYDQNMIPIIDMFKDALVQLDEGSTDLRRYIESFDRDPKSLEIIEERLTVLRALKRKYGDSEQDILDYYQKSKIELDDLLDSESRIEHLIEEESRLFSQLNDLTEMLTQKRRECALKVERNIELQLAEVNMERTRFMVEISAAELNKKGKDRVEFKISPNIGEELKPLAKIASGGEMSRIMLALKNCLAEAEKIPTLIFDEVDSGIGGRTAQKIAVKLQTLSSKFQIFSVTHLPIVASYAKYHYYIEKHETNGRTVVKVSLLDHQGRVDELVRMLGGKSNQKITTAHAKELLKHANTS
ncbi:MAG: DNA repair protein RecN [Firmicutes bacterium]|nr:DNA repair protein RecN [Bacillota bacterium]